MYILTLKQRGLVEFSEMTIEQLWELADSEEKEERAFSLTWLSLRLGEVGDFAAAISTGISGAELFNEIGNEYMEAAAHYYTGLSHYNAGDFQSGVEVSEKAAHMYRSTHDEKQIGDVILLRARCLEGLELDGEAMEAFFEAEKFYESAEKFEWSGIALLEAGEVAGRNGVQSEALGIFRDSLSMFRKAGDLIGAGRAHDRIAAALIDLDRLEEALDNLREAYNVFDYIEDLPRKTYAEFRLGWTLVTNAQFQEAIPFLENSVNKYKQMSEFGRAAKADVQLSHAHRSLGDSIMADQLLEQATSVFRSLGMTHDALINEINAAFYMTDYDLDQSISRFRTILERTAETNDVFLWNSTAIRLAEALNRKGDEQSAVESLSTLESIDLESLGEDVPTYTKYLIAYADSLYLNSKPEEAKTACMKIIDLDVSTSLTYQTAEAYRLLGYLAKNEDDDSYADHFSRAVALYLSAGLDDDARAVSTWFLPKSKGRQDTLYSDDIDLLGGDFERSDS